MNESDFYPDSESQHLEFKEQVGQDFDRIIKTLIAFANSQGGKIVSVLQVYPGYS